MEVNGFKKRLIDAKKNGEKITIIFQYPSSSKCRIRKGIVINVHNNSFDFKDRFDGLMTFSFDYISEISEWREE